MSDDDPAGQGPGVAGTPGAGSDGAGPAARGLGTRILGGLWAAATTPALPAWAAATALHPRWRSDWRERWGVEVPPTSPGALWIHAASVGEIRSAEALLEHVEGPVLITADTDTGAARARRAARGRAGMVAAARPVDHPWTLAPLWAEARPRALLFVESAWWPALAGLAARDGVPVLRSGGRPGRGTRRWGPLWRLITDGTAAVAAQDEQAAAWYAARGAPATAAGDPKVDAPLPAPALAWERPLLVGASTRAGDEQRLLDAWATAHRDAALLVAPRHPERFDEVAALLQERGVRWRRRTELERVVPAAVEVVLLDTVGELAGCLAGAEAVFVGGTFDPALGGHSPAEAIRAGVPVVAGPHRHANRAAFARAGVVEGDDLAKALRRARRRARGGVPGDRGGAGGAAARSVEVLAPWLRGPAAPPRPPRPWARPLVPAWALGARIRDAWRGRGEPARLAVPVIAVGSPNARGPGRTSTVRWLAGELAARGHRPGVAVRGYRRTRSGAGVRGSWATTAAADLGDEGALLARQGLLVAAGPDRAAAARALVDRGATVVVLDDGLGEPDLVHDTRLEVVDARFPEAAGLQPAGWRRARWSPVDGTIVHHAGERGARPIPGARALRVPGPWHPEPPQGPVFAVLGVARPGDVLASWTDVEVGGWRILADHQPVGDELARRLVEEAGDRPLVCTAKDHVRLPPWLAPGVAWRDVDLRVEGADEAWFP